MDLLSGVEGIIIKLTYTLLCVYQRDIALRELIANVLPHVACDGGG